MGDASRLPLEGVRIIDITHDWAGPHATRMLADFGAEVIKIEYVKRMDGMRGGRLENQLYNRHPRWWEINRNKLSVTLDLHDPHDAEILRDLVKITDVVVDNSRKGVSDGLGLGYDALVRIKPDIIVLSMTAFGQTGPEASYAGYGGCIEPLSGVQSLTGYDHSTRPVRVREVDVTNGVMGACAIMTALVHRQQTGRGQAIDLSQLEATTHALMGPHLMEHMSSGAQPLPLGNRDARVAPQGCYRCRGDDRWVAIAATSDEEWRRLCGAIGRADLVDDARFASAEARMRHHDELDRVIGAWTAEREPEAVTRHLQAAGVPAGTVASVEDLSRDPHLEARGFLHRAADDSGRYPGTPFRLSGITAGVRMRGPFLGEHNEYVICQLLGRPKSDVRPVREQDIGTAFDIEGPAPGAAR